MENLKQAIDIGWIIIPITCTIVSVDNCCVPTINLFDANKFQKYFVANNFKNLMKKNYPTYDHKDYKKIDLMMQSFIFKNLNKENIMLKGNL